jgi:hypothetical protein
VPTGNFGNGHQSTTRYRSSISETHVVHLHLHYLDELRRVYFKRVSAHIGFLTGIKQRSLPQSVTGHENRARYCEINIRDAFREFVSLLSRQNETHLFLRASAFSRLKETCAFNLRLLYLDERARSSGPPVRSGNGLLHCLLHCWHVCNGLSE